MEVGSEPPVSNQAISDQEAFRLFNSSNVAMVITDPMVEDHPIVYVNRAFESTTGYAAHAAVGRNCRFLQGEETDPDDVARIREAVRSVHDVTVDLMNYKADGSSFMNRLLISPIMGPDGNLRYFLGIQRPLDSRDTAISPNAITHEMREVQHRVKNHLSMIVGLIRMHERDADDAGRHFEVLSRRVEALQVLYEEMSNPELARNMDTVSLGAYLSRLVSALQQFDGRAGIRMNVSVDDVQVATDTGVSVGLVISEVLTNALKHAFNGRETGLIELRMTRLTGNGARIIVSDDGVGMDDDAEWPDTSSVGGRVIQGLIQQLDGKVAVMRGANGTVVTLDLPQIADQV